MTTETKLLPVCLIELTTRDRYPIETELLVGRESGFKSEHISRRHCLFKIEGNRVHVSDQNSTNGTYLNRQKLRPDTWYEVEVGDQIKVGDLEFELLLDPTVRRKVIPLKPNPKPPEKTLNIYPYRVGAWVLDLLLIGLAITALDMLLPHLSAILGLLLNFTVYILMTFIPMRQNQQTLGKKIVGLKVISLDGSALTMEIIFMREIGFKLILLAALPLAVAGFLSSIHTALMPVSLLVFYAYILINFIQRRRTFWDRLCNTKVVFLDSEKAAGKK